MISAYMYSLITTPFNGLSIPIFFVMNTLFFCKIQWQDKLMSFDSYEEYGDLYGCHKPKGACLLKIDEGIYDFCF